MEIIERQNEIIRIQSDSVNELFRLLMEHITVEEADQLPVLKKLNLAAEIKAEISNHC
jgi:hypothetical protein